MATTTRTEQAHTGDAVPGRGRRIVSWVLWHLAELAGVLGPALLAVLASPWFWLAAGVVLAVWTVHEVRPARSVRAVRNGSNPSGNPPTGDGRDTPTHAAIESNTGADVGTDPGTSPPATRRPRLTR